MAIADQRTTKKHCIPLYPSYLFVYLIPGESDFATVGNTYGVRWLVKTGDYYHTAPPDLIETLKERHNEHDLIEVGKSRFEVGDAVAFKQGFMKGYRGAIESLKKDKADIWCYTGDKLIENVALELLEPVHN